MKLKPLPKIMVAPNGARRNRTHHPNIPLTDDALIETVKACSMAGAGGVHLHIRDENGKHIIDSARYRALLDKLERVVPDMYLQVTSESAGLYEAAQQQAMMRELRPRHVSVALREMVRKPEDWSEASAFYSWASNNNLQIQHILYSPEELQQFITAIGDKKISGNHHLLQFVLGTYDGTVVSRPDQVSNYCDVLRAAPDEYEFDWMLCAFGKHETSCLIEAISQGGKARIGFENSFHNTDGTVAASNAERVEELLSHL